MIQAAFPAACLSLITCEINSNRWNVKWEENELPYDVQAGGETQHLPTFLQHRPLWAGLVLGLGTSRASWWPHTSQHLVVPSFPVHPA